MLFLLLILWVSSFFPEKRLWGINHWAYFPLWLRTAVIGLAVSVFVPQLNRKLRAFLRLTVVSVFRSLMERRRYQGWALVGTVSLLLFYLFRSKIPLLGDGFQVTESLNAGALSVNWSQPLAIWIYVASFKILGKILHPNGAAVYALISYLSGVVFIIYALKAAILLGKEWSTRLFVFFILILMGSTQLFLGYAEHYPLLFSGILIFLFYGLKNLRGETRVLVPVVVFLVLLPLHFSSLYLLPSVLFLLIVSGKRKALVDVLRSKRTWGTLLFLVLISVSLALYIWKYNWYVFSYLMPLVHGSYTGPGYTLLSPSHLLDFLNQQILISPVGLALLFVFWIFKPEAPNKRDRIFQFLLTVSAGQLAFNFLIDPGLGAPRDWDLFASVGLGYTFLTLYVFSQVAAQFEVGHLKLRLTTVALLFTLPWILINASGDLSIARFRNLLDLDPKKSRNGHFVLAGYFDGMGRTEEVERENRMVKEKFPEIGLVTRGMDFLNKGELQRGYEIIIKAIELSPDFAEARAALACYCVKTGDLRKAEMELRRALKLKPEYRAAYEDLGDIYMKKGNFKEAEKCYTRAMTMGVDKPYVMNNLAILYAQSDKLEKAASFYRKAIARESDFVESHYGLAFVYYQQGKLEESLIELNLLLRIDPNFALGYYQLGQTCARLGRKGEAISAYQRYLQMQPSDPRADQIRQTIRVLASD